MRVLLYTDSPFFSGAENMIATFLGDDALREEFALELAYRHSSTFERGARERLPSMTTLRPLELLDVPTRTESMPAYLRSAAKGYAYLSGAKYRYVRENTRRLARIFEEIKPDLLHINSGGYPGAYSTLAAVLAARRVGIKRVVYVANNIAMPYSWRRAMDRGLDGRVVAGVDTFVTGSSFAGDALAQTLGIDRTCVRTIPNGVSQRALVEPASQVRTRIGAPSGRPLAVVVANLETRKGHAHLIRALGILKHRGDDPLPWLAIEGTGPKESALRELVVALGLDRDVAFLGREERVFDLMSAADIVVLPSIANEDFPNVVLEAMSLSKPVLASRIAGTPEQIMDGETGVLVEPGDEQALADALATLAREPESRNLMGAAGKERFEQRFTAAHAVEAYRRLWLELEHSDSSPAR